MNEDAVMTSDDGFFEITPISGTGINKTPWTGYRVRSLYDARDLGVVINLDQDSAEYVSKPIKIHYTGASITYGLTLRKQTTEDIERFIRVLEDAVSFVREIERNLDILN